MQHLSRPLDLWPVARKLFPGNAPGRLLLQARTVLAAAREWPLVQQMLQAPPDSAMGRLLQKRPDMLGVLIWPYLSASFDAGERLRRILDHNAVVDRLGAPFDFDCDQRLILVDLADIHPGLMLVLDQPVWFQREGGFTLNLFLGSFRAFSLAFSLRPEPDGTLSAWIGGLQGRNREDMLETYRQLTKSLHGMRPRDFLLECMKLLCRHLGVTRLYGVSDAARHHRHRFFRGRVPTGQNYDDIWLDREGTRIDRDFFALPLAAERRDEASIKPNKRPMYRRRFEFLDSLEREVILRLPTLQPTWFEDS